MEKQQEITKEVLSMGEGERDRLASELDRTQRPQSQQTADGRQNLGLIPGRRTHHIRYLTPIQLSPIY